MITVNADPRIEQLTVLIRQALLVLAPVATYFGWTHAAGLIAVLIGVAGSIATVIVIIMGQLHTRATVASKVALAVTPPANVKVIGQ